FVEILCRRGRGSGAHGCVCVTLRQFASAVLAATRPLPRARRNGFVAGTELPANRRRAPRKPTLARKRVLRRSRPGQWPAAATAGQWLALVWAEGSWAPSRSCSPSGSAHIAEWLCRTLSAEGRRGECVRTVSP